MEKYVWHRNIVKIDSLSNINYLQQRCENGGLRLPNHSTNLTKFGWSNIHVRSPYFSFFIYFKWYGMRDMQTIKLLLSCRYGCLLCLLLLMLLLQPSFSSSSFLLFFFTYAVSELILSHSPYRNTPLCAIIMQCMYFILRIYYGCCCLQIHKANDIWFW